MNRPVAEPAALKVNRDKYFPTLEKLIAISGTFNPDTIEGYEVARDELFSAQHHKCCYCERYPLKKYQAVEHYRPKSIYWWLAWTWSNLLFVCEVCNGNKGNRFPLLSGVPLSAGRPPPGRERPAILDPADQSQGGDPLGHIVFRKTPRGWVPFAREGSRRGYWTIRHCGLDQHDLLELYDVRDRQIRSALKPLRDALESRDVVSVQTEWAEVASIWLSPSMDLTALSRDILDHHVPPAVRKKYGISLDLTPPWTP